MNKMTLRLNEEDVEKLEDIIKNRKYRVTKTEAIRFLIQDSWELDNLDKTGELRKV